MSMSKVDRMIAIAALLTIITSACSVTDPILRPGWRHITMSVMNESLRPATLVVAADTMPMGAVVGTADPATVPAERTIDVTFGLPPGSGWAIWVNPGRADIGPLIISNDVPDHATGRAPISIGIDERGDIYASHQGDIPGWMGNP